MKSLFKKLISLSSMASFDLKPDLLWAVQNSWDAIGTFNSHVSFAYFDNTRRCLASGPKFPSTRSRYQKMPINSTAMVKEGFNWAKIIIFGFEIRKKTFSHLSRIYYILDLFRVVLNIKEYMLRPTECSRLDGYRLGCSRAKSSCACAAPRWVWSCNLRLVAMAPMSSGC